MVASKTYLNYVTDIMQFLSWSVINKPEWVTDYGKARLQYIFVERANERARARSKRIRLQMKVLLRQCEGSPIMEVDLIRPREYMDFVLSLRHNRHGGYLSKSAYGSKRSALYHLFRLHNQRGYTEEFKSKLGNLFRGFNRQLQVRRAPRATAAPRDDEGAEDQPPGPERAWHSEGKEPMSVELFELLAKGFLDWGTIDGVFSFAFLVLSWHLACRSSNTANIRFSEINWSTSFDSFEVYFAHSKTDQTGADAKHSRHLFANPNNPLFCPVFALSCFFSVCNTQQGFNDPLFPGNDQHERFASSLQRLLQEKEVELNRLGYQLHDIGTHSIRKGAVSYLASLVGGPPAAAVCIRSGHSMGQVRDVYMRYVQAGDEFVGRALALAPILSDRFGASPPFFADGYSDTANDLAQQQFPMQANMPHLRKMLRMCLASLVYHRNFVNNLIPNHVVRLASQTLREQGTLDEIEGNNAIKVTLPWTDRDHVFTGIPPHVAVLQKLSLIRTEQQGLIEGFVGNVKKAIEESGVGGGLPGERLDRLFEQLQERLDQIGGPVAAREGAGGGLRIERQPRFTYHMYDGRFHRLPKDWRFPRVGVMAVWRMWWIGDTVQQVPPLRELKGSDFQYLDQLELQEEEMHARTGRFKGNRRKSTKLFSDLSFLMEYCTAQVSLKGGLVEEITLQSVDDMYALIEPEFTVSGPRNAQKKWTTHVKETRKKLRELRAANNQ